nr:hypothetical protein [Tanacetum cinerariifolium]
MSTIYTRNLALQVFILVLLLCEVDRDCLLGLLKQEVSEDVARVKGYRAMACGLKVALRRRKEYIKELKSLGDCKDVVESVMFMERMQLNDMEKCTRSLLRMKDTQVKMREKASMTGDSTSSIEQVSCENGVAVSSVDRDARESGNECMNRMAFMVDQEIIEDRARLEVYWNLALQLTESVRRKTKYINELKGDNKRSCKVRCLLEFSVAIDGKCQEEERYGEGYALPFNVEGDIDEDKGKGIASFVAFGVSTLAGVDVASSGGTIAGVPITVVG